jgi:hypothetical protein
MLKFIHKKLPIQGFQKTISYSHENFTYVCKVRDRMRHPVEKNLLSLKQKTIKPFSHGPR